MPNPEDEPHTAAQFLGDLEILEGRVREVEGELRLLAGHLAGPGVTDEVPEANAQLMLAVRACEDAWFRIRRLESMINR